MKDAVLDSEQEAAGYDDGEFHAATDLDNKVHINDHKLSRIYINRYI